MGYAWRVGGGARWSALVLGKEGWRKGETHTHWRKGETHILRAHILRAHRRIHVRNMTHWCVRHDIFMCAT